MVGGISQSDVNLAIAANAIIVAFNVRAESTAKQLIQSNDITVVYSGVIYEALDELKETIVSQVGPNLIEEVIATANVLKCSSFPRLAPWLAATSRVAPCETNLRSGSCGTM